MGNKGPCEVQGKTESVQPENNPRSNEPGENVRHLEERVEQEYEKQKRYRRPETNPETANKSRKNEQTKEAPSRMEKKEMNWVKSHWSVILERKNSPIGGRVVLK